MFEYQKATMTSGCILSVNKWNIQKSLLIFQILLVNSVLCFYINDKQSPGSHQWSYNQQGDWSAEHKECNFRAQSPIDIQRKHVIQNNQLRLHFYNYNQVTKFKILNGHHTIRLKPITELNHLLQVGNLQDHQAMIKLPQNSHHETGHSENQSNAANNSLTSSEALDMIEKDIDVSDMVEPVFDSKQKSKVIVHDQNRHPVMAGDNSLESEHSSQQPYNGAPTIKLDWLDDGNNEFKMRDIHFHWAERRDNGSEHAIDGRRSAMEMHLVHTKVGLDESSLGYTSDSIVVISVLIESYRKSNADFNPIVNALTRINMTDQPQEIEYKSINDLLPNILTSFYTYSGSLTTPPCYQVVNWIVMHDRLYMNAKQLEMFRNLYAPMSHEQDDEHSPEPPLIMPNVRQLQTLNNRTILASFSPFGKLEQQANGVQVNNDFSLPYSGALSLHQQYLDATMVILVSMMSLALSILSVLCRAPLP